MTVLEVKEMTMAFGGLTAVNNLSFSVNENEVVGLIGPNGSGKTTTINCIAGNYAPRRGQVVFKRKDITGLKPHEIAALGLSRTFQLTTLLARETVLDNVLTGLHLRTGENIWDALIPTDAARNKERRATDIALEILDFVGIGAEKHRVCSSISNYSRKCLSLAVALASKPQMLLVDEVVSGLSADEIGKVMALITRIRESGVAVLLVEHNMRVIMSLCDRIIVLNFGAKIAEGPPAEIQANPEVQSAYLGCR